MSDPSFNPLQETLVIAIIDAVPPGVKPITACPETEQPFTSVAVTVYVPAITLFDTAAAPAPPVQVYV